MKRVYTIIVFMIAVFALIYYFYAAQNQRLQNVKLRGSAKNSVDEHKDCGCGCGGNCDGK